MFGSTIQAQTAVLAVFMGGLALGNRVCGREGDTVRTPIAVYGGIEVAIAVYAFLFHLLYAAADAAFVKLGSGKLDATGYLLFLKMALSALLLLGPTILMGGTLPLIS